MSTSQLEFATLLAPGPAPNQGLAPGEVESRLSSPLSSGVLSRLGGGERVLLFDVETTGTDRRRDQIIELCLQHGLADDAPYQVWRFRPSVPIDPGAQAVHGIAVEDLADCAPFSEHVDEIRRLFSEASVLVGYNLAFDMDMLSAEYERLGLPQIDFSQKTIVDPFRLWQQCEPRSLQHAHQRFVGAEFAAAHSASADVAATGRVLRGMLAAFGLEERGWSEIATVCDPHRDQRQVQRQLWVGPSKHFVWQGEAIAVGFGRHAGAIAHELAAADPAYFRWMLDKDFPVHVHDICKAVLRLGKDEFLRWAESLYPSAAAAAAAAAAAVAAKGPGTVQGEG